MKLDSYTIVARIFPALISAIPFFVLHFFYLRKVLGQFWGELLGLRVVSDLTISLAFLFLLVQLARSLSKELFEKELYSGGQDLPTTRCLLHQSPHFSREYKHKIHQRIAADFGIAIPPASEEANDEFRSRKLIGEAVSQIRAKVGKGNLVGQHNAEYGFWRNLAGGSLIATVVCIANLVVFGWYHYERLPFWSSLILVLFYSLHIGFAKKMIVASGDAYASVLVQEYVGRSAG